MKIDCTIIIPTKNRYKHLSSLLDYYVRENYNGSIFICDSSNSPVNSELKSRYINSPFEWQYFYNFGWPWQVIKNVLPNIVSDYVIFTGDDDYIIVDSLKKIAEFLDDPKNSKYQGATGHSYLLFSNERTGFDNIVIYDVEMKNENSSLERVESLLSSYKVPLFSLIRRKTFVKVVDAVDLDSSKWLRSTQFINDEVLISCMLVAYGKIAFQNLNFLIRNIHPERNLLLNEPPPLKFYNYAINYFVLQLDIAISINDVALDAKKPSSIRDSFVEYIYEIEKRRNQIDNKLITLVPSSITFKQRLRLIFTQSRFFMFLYIILRANKLNTIETYSLAKNCYKIYLGMPSYK